jgi:hypothetical protein
MTQDQLERKAVLERENRELEREQKLRQDLIRLRIQRIQAAQIKKDREESARKTEMVQHRRLEIAKILQKKGDYPQILRQTPGLPNLTPNSLGRNTISRPGQKVPNANGVISDGFDPLDLDWSDDDFQ